MLSSMASRAGPGPRGHAQLRDAADDILAQLARQAGATRAARAMANLAKMPTGRGPRPSGAPR